MNFFQSVTWIFFRINWRAWIFFHVIFPCANIFFCTSLDPPRKFSNGPSLIHRLPEGVWLRSHSTLLHKLEHNFGITRNLLEWLRDYLSEREQYIVINGIPSKNTKVAHGIPQGFLLGPNSSPRTQAIYRKQLTLQQRSWSDNSNSLWMTKQEDILLCYVNPTPWGSASIGETESRGMISTVGKRTVTFSPVILFKITPTFLQMICFVWVFRGKVLSFYDTKRGLLIDINIWKRYRWFIGRTERRKHKWGLTGIKRARTSETT